MWEDSPNTKRILDYFTSKYCLSVAPIGLAKALSVASLKVENAFPLSIINVSPAGHFKTRLSKEQVAIFGNKPVIEFGSDFTMHGISKKYNRGLGMNNKCCLINDLTLLFGSKSKSAKERLINALAELLSDGAYGYNDFQNDWLLKARISIIGNITMESYTKYYRELIESTFGERCLTLFHIVNNNEESKFNLEKEERMGMFFGDKVKLRKLRVDYHDQKPKLDEIAGKWTTLALSPSRTRIYDRIVSLVTSNVVLNGRKKVVDDDLWVLNLLENYLVCQTSKHFEIISLALKGLNQIDICRAMGKDPITYQPYVSKVIGIYRGKGVLK